MSGLPVSFIYPPCFCICTTEAFVVLGTNTQCGTGTLLATREECSSAKTVLDPRAGDDVLTETFANAPKGCSRYKEGGGS